MHKFDSNIGSRVSCEVFFYPKSILGSVRLSDMTTISEVQIPSNMPATLNLRFLCTL